MLSVSPGSNAEKKRIGERIAEARRAKGLTQRALAELVGVKERAVQGWEQGETHPYRRLPILERVLGRDRDWLLGVTTRGALAGRGRPSTEFALSDREVERFLDDEPVLYDALSAPRRSLKQTVDDIAQQLDQLSRRLGELERVIDGLRPPADG
jgi:transcriptional regulator with XRE-family HTH domain